MRTKHKNAKCCPPDHVGNNIVLQLFPIRIVSYRQLDIFRQGFHFWHIVVFKSVEHPFEKANRSTQHSPNDKTRSRSTHPEQRHPPHVILGFLIFVYRRGNTHHGKSRPRQSRTRVRPVTDYRVRVTAYRTTDKAKHEQNTNERFQQIHSFNINQHGPIANNYINKWRQYS